VSLTELRARHDAIEAELRAIDTEAGDAALSTEQNERFDALVAERSTVSASIKSEERRAGLRADLAAKAPVRTEGGDSRDAGAPVARGVITSEPLTYSRHNNNSYFLDTARAQLRRDPEAMERLNRHAREMIVEMPAREARRAGRRRPRSPRSRA
jgi:hypothetical protein